MMKTSLDIGRVVVITCLIAFGQSAAAAADCETHARNAEKAHGLPSGLLVAIARTESGRSQGDIGFAAWPWTLNVEGKGHYFKTRKAARAHLDAVLETGVRSVDIGCMQINYRWHEQEFGDLAAMLDPASNTDYAARYLKSLRDQTGSWEKATAYYHSRDPDRGAAYHSRVAQHHKKVGAAAPEEVVVAAAAPAGPLSVPVSTPILASQATDSRFQSRPALVSLPGQSEFLSSLDLPQGKLPKSLSEVRAKLN